MIKPEILAPAGSMDSLKAAIHAGCDAVYLGGTRFGARAYAGNFNETELIDAINYAHLYNVKIYLTVNTLFRNDELRKLYSYLLPYYDAGLDAVIVQDFGVMEFIHKQFPDLPIHASTQMTITTSYAYSILREYGVVRLVPARELSIGELTAIKNVDDPPEVEVFVQGALCICYSGQCFMSSFLGGRSGNRGRCAGSCRLPYKIYDENGKPIKTDGRYLLSTKDLCGLESIPELIMAGVDSFKIEGRMKKPEYVAACVRSYRKCVDSYIEHIKAAKTSPDSWVVDNCALINECIDDMASVFNRGGFTKGYFHTNNGKAMMSTTNPGNSGVHIGKVCNVKGNQVHIMLSKPVNIGDIFVLNDTDSDITLTCNIEGKTGSMIVLNVPKAREISTGMSVSRVFDIVNNKELEEYLNEPRKIDIYAKAFFKKGEKARLIISANHRGEEFFADSYGINVEEASSKPVTIDIIRDKLSQVGNTNYNIKELIIDADSDIFYPLKELKSLRREAISHFEGTVYEKHRRDKVPPISIDYCKEKNNYQEPQLDVIVSSNEQLEVLSKIPNINNIYVDLQFFDKEDIMNMINTYPEYGYALPPILRQDSLNELYELPLAECRCLIVRNIDELAYLKYIEYKGIVVTDYTLYAMNDHAAHFLKSQFERVNITFPVELNREQIKGLTYNGQLTVYGYQPLMVTAQCFCNNTSYCTKANPHFILKDRKSQSFYTSSICKYCYNIIYNGIPTVLFDCIDVKEYQSIRFDFTTENYEQTYNIVSSFINACEYNGNKTRGHFKRGIE